MSSSKFQHLFRGFLFPLCSFVEYSFTDMLHYIITETSLKWKQKSTFTNTVTCKQMCPVMHQWSAFDNMAYFSHLSLNVKQ